jgi:aryl-alcohol dehydrogenase
VTTSTPRSCTSDVARFEREERITMTMKTIAAVVEEAGAPFRLEEVELDEPRPDEVVVRMVATGLCHTDLAAQAGAFPFPLPGVLGHEGAGVVEQAGEEVRGIAPGDHVLASFTSCGTCSQCNNGHPSSYALFHPLNLSGGTRDDGSPTISRGGKPIHGHFFGQSSLARHALVDERSLIKVPKAAPLAVLALLGCGIQTGAGTVLNALRPRAGAKLAVFGAGAVGCAAIMAAVLSGATRIVAVDLAAQRLELARARCYPQRRRRRGRPGRGARRARRHGLRSRGHGQHRGARPSDHAPGPGGTCALVSTNPPGATIPLDVNHMLDGRRLMGVSEGDSVPQLFVPTLVDLYEQGRLPIDRLIRRYPFKDIERAAADARAGTTVEPVLTFD